MDLFRIFSLILLIICTLYFVICNSTFALTPNDTSYPQQWGLTAISAEAGWNTTTGSASVIIAIISSGIDGNFDDKRGTLTHYNFPEGSLKGHPDINPHVVKIDGSWTNTDEAWSNLWINTRELPPGSPPEADGSNDHDRNGYNNDVHGANLVQVATDSFQKNTMYSTDPYDDNYVGSSYGMGTRLSGIAGAITNRIESAEGIAGVAWKCKLMHIRVIDFNGAPASGSFEAGIRYAADNGAKVILLPFKRNNLPNDYVYSYWDAITWDQINAAIQYAHDVKGCVVIGPVGNSGTATEEAPAKFDNVIGVGSIKKNDDGTYSRSNFSNYNKYVDIVAPGENILSAALSGKYESFSDTGAAAAFVAGYAGLIFSANPTWTNTKVEQQIINTAAPLPNTAVTSPDYTVPRGSVRNNNYGYGLIDLSAGLDVTAPPTPTVNPLVTPTNISAYTLTGTMSSYPMDTRRILVNSSETGITYLTSTTWSQSGTLTKGVNKLQVTAKDAAGNESAPATVEVELKDMPFSDISGNNTITFPIDSTSAIPSATIEVYSGAALDPAGPAAAAIISSAMNFTSSLSPLAGKTVTIKIKITGSTVNPAPYFWDSAAKIWRNTGLTVTAKDASSVTFTTTRSSGIFAIFDVTGNLADILIYPIPYKIGGTDPNGVVFSGLKGDEVIRIYTLSGELVASSSADYLGTQTWTWQAKNSSDYIVAQDIYYFLITNGAGQKRTGKIAVIN